MIFRKWVILILVVSFALGCKKKEKFLNQPPEIEFVSITPNEIIQFKTKVVIRLKYRDVDGDIGEENADVYSVKVKDSRLDKPDYYHVKPLSPVGSNVSIEGEVEVEVPTLFLLGNGNEELIVFNVSLHDMEGNWSNEIITPEIKVKRE